MDWKVIPIRPHCYIHLLFVAISVFGVDHQSRSTIFAIVFWGLATASVLTCVHEIRRENKDSNKDLATHPLPGGLEPEPKHLKGLHILQARYGCKTVDVDVTEKVKAMVNNGQLVLDKSLSFNRAFTDPCMFRLKKLRLVALVDGRSYVNAFNEIRTETITIPDGSDGSGTSFHEEIGPEGSESPTARNVKGAAAPGVAITTKEFNALHISLPFKGIQTEPFLHACEVLADFACLFGTAFLPVRVNVTDNIVKIRSQVSNASKGGSIVPAELSGLILAEVKAGKARTDGSACVSSLWLKRAMDFFNCFLCAVVIDGMETGSASEKAYTTTLEPWHGFGLKLTCRTAFKMVPGRTSFLNAVRNGDSADDTLLSELEGMLKALGPVVVAMDHWFDENDLNFSDKA